MVSNRQITIWNSLIKDRDSQAIITSVDHWLESIENPGPIHKELILRARSLDKNSEEYKKIKKSLPVAQLNGVFPNRVQDSLRSLSGLAYLDVDNGDTDSLKETLNKSPYVYAYWKSVSGNGLGILVSYTNPNNITFNEVLEEIAEVIGIPLDPHAKGLARTNFLSYDPEIYYNSLAIPYEVLKKCLPTIIKVPNDHSSKSTLSEISDFRTELTLDDYPEDVMFITKPYFKAYWPWVTRGTPKTIEKGNRTSVMGMFICNLAILNPNHEEQVTALALTFNRHYCSPPLKSQEVYSLIKWSYKNLATLKPLGVKNKKIWVNPSLGNKLKAIGEAKIARNILLIEDCLSYLLCGQRKITATLISRETSLSRKTIYKYIHYFSEDIKSFNLALRNEKR